MMDWYLFLAFCLLILVQHFQIRSIEKRMFSYERQLWDQSKMLVQLLEQTRSARGEPK